MLPYNKITYISHNNSSFYMLTPVQARILYQSVFPRKSPFDWKTRSKDQGKCTEMRFIFSTWNNSNPSTKDYTTLIMWRKQSRADVSKPKTEEVFLPPHPERLRRPCFLPAWLGGAAAEAGYHLGGTSTREAGLLFFQSSLFYIRRVMHHKLRWKRYEWYNKRPRFL